MKVSSRNGSFESRSIYWRNEWFRNEYGKSSYELILPYSMNVSIYQRILKFANTSREQDKHFDSSIICSVAMTTIKWIIVFVSYLYLFNCGIFNATHSLARSICISRMYNPLCIIHRRYTNFSSINIDSNAIRTTL